MPEPSILVGGAGSSGSCPACFLLPLGLCTGRPAPPSTHRLLSTPLRSTRTCLLPPTPPARVQQGSGTPGVHTCHSERALTLLPQLQRKMEERRLRLQEAANKCVPASGPRTSGGGGAGGGSRACLSSPEVLRPVLPSRRFCSQVALTPEEREQRALYAAILEYEQDHVSAGRGGLGRSSPRGAALVREEGLPGALSQGLLSCRTGQSTGRPSSRGAQGTCPW